MCLEYIKVTTFGLKERYLKHTHVSTKLKSTLKKESWSCWIREDLALPNLLFAWQLEYMSVKRIKKKTCTFTKNSGFCFFYMQSTCNLKLGSQLLLEGEDT